MRKLLLKDYQARKMIADNLKQFINNKLSQEQYIDISDEEYERIQNAINLYNNPKEFIDDSEDEGQKSILSLKDLYSSLNQSEEGFAVSFIDLYDRMGVLEASTTSYINNYLNNVQNIKAELIRSDWNEENPLSYAYIENKPEIPEIPTETKLSYVISGAGNAFTNISVNNHKITLDKGTYFLTSDNISNSLKTINNQSIVGQGNVTLSGLPDVTSAHNGKTLMVINGQWAMISPSTFYSGSGVPNDINGNDGDIYIQTNS